MAFGGSPHRRRHGGVAAIEFALVLPILLALVLGIVYYGMVLAVQQVLTLAAEEGARAALRYPLTSNGGTLANTIDLRVAAAAQTATNALPATIAANLQSSTAIAQAELCSAPAGAQCVRVTLNLPTQTMVPAIPLVPVPATLTGSAVVQLSPDT